jgi:hypothetical protein
VEQFVNELYMSAETCEWSFVGTLKIVSSVYSVIGQNVQYCNI